MTKERSIWILSVATPLAAVCAPSPPPTERMASAESAVRVVKRHGDQSRMDSSAERQREASQAELARKRQYLATTKEQLRVVGTNLESEHRGRDEAEKRAWEAVDTLAIANAFSVKDEPRGTVITVPASVLFASGKTDLLPGPQRRLGQVADALSQEKAHDIAVVGHTDSHGSDASNMDQSMHEAQAVKDFFVSRGLDADHVIAMGVGERRPIANNSTAEGRANNRRVEIVIQPSEARSWRAPHAALKP